MKILIIGNGKIGQAIFHLLRTNPKNKGISIETYDKDESKNKSRKTLAECAFGVNIIFLCIPSWTEEEVLLEIVHYIKPQTILISLSKGINIASRKSMDQLIEKDAHEAKYALLSGPMFAPEIIEDKMSYGVLASKDRSVYKKVAPIFSGTKLKLEYERDVHSVAMSGVLKNIYTLAFGMLEGYGEKNNTRGFFSAMAIKEMLTVAKILKLDKKIVVGTAGVGDFIATSGSEHSQNRRLGKEIFEHGEAIFPSEGFVSFGSLLFMLGPKAKKLPLFSLLIRILVDKKNPKAELEKFLREI